MGKITMAFLTVFRTTKLEGDLGYGVIEGYPVIDIAAMVVTIFSSTAGPIGCIRTKTPLDFGAAQNTNPEFQDIYADSMSFDI